MPINSGSIDNTGWQFQFNVSQLQQYWIDPLVAVGYDYIVNSGPNMASVILPNIGDGLFNLHLWDGIAWQYNGVLNAGQEYLFASGGVDRFRIDGIETGAGLDPNDPNAFVTGLTFAGSGTVNMQQIALSFDTGTGANIPAPSVLVLFGLGLLGIRAARRRV